jgi:hypothetical protein
MNNLKEFDLKLVLGGFSIKLILKEIVNPDVKCFSSCPFCLLGLEWFFPFPFFLF